MSRHPDVTVVGSINQDMVARVPRLPGAGQTVLGHELVIAPGGQGAEPGRRRGPLGGEHGLRRHGRRRQRRDPPARRPRGRGHRHARRARGGCAHRPGAHRGRRRRREPHRRGARRELGRQPGPHRPPPGRGSTRPGWCWRSSRSRIDAVEEALQRAKAAGAHDHPQRHAPGRARAPALIRSIDFLVVNEHEAAAMAGMAVSTPADAAAAGAALRAQGCGVAIVTLGVRGRGARQRGGRRARARDPGRGGRHHRGRRRLRGRVRGPPGRRRQPGRRARVGRWPPARWPSPRSGAAPSIPVRPTSNAARSPAAALTPRRRTHASVAQRDRGPALLGAALDRPQRGQRGDHVLGAVRQQPADRRARRRERRPGRDRRPGPAASGPGGWP